MECILLEVIDHVHVVSMLKVLAITTALVANAMSSWPIDAFSC